MKKVIVISGANLYAGGTLSIIQDALAYLDTHLAKQYTIVALVYNKKDFRHLTRTKLIEIRQIRKSYLHRLYFEYYWYRFISRRLKPYLWFSLNDMSSGTTATIKAVYCHNPTPFRKLVFSELTDEPSLFFFTLFYKLLYRINIHQNRYVVVQQQWMRQQFVKTFRISPKKIIVAPPAASHLSAPMLPASAKNTSKTVFFFPTLPRPFKNIEVIGEALLRLPKALANRYEVIITIQGNENGYAKRIISKYGHLPTLKFIGFVQRSQVFDLYSKTDCLLFPSRLETWGLPISEFKAYNKPMLVADKAYARETVGDYNKAAFFLENDSSQLAQLMQEVMEGTLAYSKTANTEYAPPVAYTWQRVFDYLLQPSAPEALVFEPKT